MAKRKILALVIMITGISVIAYPLAVDLIQKDIEFRDIKNHSSPLFEKYKSLQRKPFFPANCQDILEIKLPLKTKCYRSAHYAAIDYGSRISFYKMPEKKLIGGLATFKNEIKEF